MKRLQVKDTVILARKMMFVFLDIIFLPLSFILITLLGSASINVPYDYGYLYLSIIYIFVYLILIILFRLYRYVWVYARVKDYVSLIIILILANTTIYLIGDIFIPYHQNYPIVIYLFSFFASVFIVLIPRFLRVLFYEMRKREENLKKANFPIKRTLIIGGGWTGNAILKELKNGLSQYDPVCILDDDIRKANMYIQDIPVVGNTNQVEAKVKEFDIDTIIFAIPSLSEKERIRILEQCVRTKKETRVLPYTHEIEKEISIVSQIQEVNIEDLLGRKQQLFDDHDVKEYIQGKICLVSGGGGSIGSEICRQIAKYRPKQLLIIDIYENTTYDIEQELLETYQGSIDVHIEIASITDKDKCRAIFEKYRPQIVFHAAAHKHVPLMETVPEQAVKNNIGGTLNLVDLAVTYQVERFVLISTDKAVNPTNVMGATKRVCEMIMRCYAQKQTVTTRFCAVRFGNVLGSNGSVIPLFRKQISHGGPVRVTDKNVTRFFMTISEAVALVLKTGALALGGEIFILDMGQPVRILDLAENLIRLSGFEPYKDIAIEFVGLRPGEKLYEELLLSEEDSKTTQEKVFITNQPTLDECVLMSAVQTLLEAAYRNDIALVLQQLKTLVPTFHHALNGKNGS